MNYEGYEIKKGSKIEKVDELVTDIGIARKYQEVDYADLSFDEYCELSDVKEYEKDQSTYEDYCRMCDEQRNVWLDKELETKEELQNVMKEIPSDALNSFLSARANAYRKDIVENQKAGDMIARTDADYQVKATNTARAIALKIEKEKQK